MAYLEFWHWWALGLCFVVIEAVMPSGVFASMAIAGGAVGAFALIWPDITWQAQLGGFAAVTMAVSYPATYFYRRRLGSHNSIKQAASHVMGREIELTMPIQNGFGEITIDDTIWGLKGPDIKKGTLVRIIGLDGDMLVVRAITKKTETDQVVE